jgi:type II secretory pathway pseudopilin PulG
MSLIRNGPPVPRASAEEGTTLIELLVAMVIAVVVVGALFAILEFSTRQETRVSNKVQATRIGRLAMSKVVDELHSACTGFGATAVQVPIGATPTEKPESPLAVTGPTDLWFISTYGTSESGAAAPAKVIEHDIHWQATGGKSASGQTLGTLTDYRYESQPESSPEAWKFKALTVANASKRVIAENVIPPSSPASSTIFSYFKFKSETSTELQPLSTQAEITAAATKPEEGDNTLAKVNVSWVQAPEARDSTPATSVAVTDSVLFRFNPTETGSEAENVPCA